MAAQPIPPAAAADALRKLHYQRRQLVLAEMTRALMGARDDAVTKYMYPQAPASVLPQPDRLTHRSGALGRSTKVNPPRVVGDSVVGGLVTGGPTAPYGPIHELGGTTGAHDIRPIRGKVLAWTGPSGPRFATLVHHPGSRIPARPRIRPALVDALPRLNTALTEGFRRLQNDVGLG
jgi:hypothetical protein